MWKLFFKNLLLIPLKLIAFALGFFVLMCFIAVVFAIGTPAFIIIGVGFFLWYCYWKAATEQKAKESYEKRRILDYLDNNLNLLYYHYARKNYEKVEDFKNEFKKLMESYEKQFGRDSYYTSYFERYNITINEENWVHYD